MYTLANINHETPVITSLTTGTVEERKRAYNALNNQAGKVSEIVGLDVELSDFHCELSKYVDEDGEVEESVKTILILSDGSSYYTYSKILAKSLFNFINIFGMPGEWGSPAIVKLTLQGKGYGMNFIGFRD